MPISLIRRHSDLTGASETENEKLYFIPSSEFNAHAAMRKYTVDSCISNTDISQYPCININEYSSDAFSIFLFL